MNPFSFMYMNEKNQKAYRIKSYDEVLIASIIPMIEWNNLPDTVNFRFLEYLRLTDGAAAIWKLDEKYIASHVTFGDAPYTDGIGSRAICTTNNGHVKEFEDWRNNSDVVIIFNDSTYSPDVNIGRFADMLSELEISMKCLVRYSRLYPIPIAKDDHQKKMIDEALKGLDVGKFSTILDKNGIDILVDGTSGIDILNMTDASLSDKIQYLSHFRDDLFRWFYSLYGMNTQGSSKMAQQTQSETEQNANSSMIIPTNRLKEAKIGADDLNAKFGWNVSVEFNECWQSKMVDLDADGDGIIDEEPEVEEPEVEQEDEENEG